MNQERQLERDRNGKSEIERRGRRNNGTEMGESEKKRDFVTHRERGDRRCDMCIYIRLSPYIVDERW